MAITTQGVKNFGLRVRLAVFFTLASVFISMAIGWHYQASKLAENERPHAFTFAVGLVMTKLDLDKDQLTANAEPLRVFQHITQQFPQNAENMRLAAYRAFLFPWPVLGLFAGVGLLAGFSKLLTQTR